MKAIVKEEHIEISTRLSGYLLSWFETSTTRKAAQGIKVELTYPQFVNLFSAKQIQTLENAISSNRLRALQDRTNPFAFVLTWKSKEARASCCFAADTAMVCSRQKSERIHKLRSGDTHRPDSIAKMRKPKSEEHRANMRKPKSPEHKAAMAQAARERWAKVRAAKESK